MDAAFFMGSYKLNSKGLNDRHQSHIGISGHRNGAHVVGAQHLGYQDGCRAVCRADDTDGSRVL